MIYFDSAANEVVIKMTGADADNFRCNTRDQLSDSEVSEMLSEVAMEIDNDWFYDAVYDLVQEQCNNVLERHGHELG